MDLAYLKSIRLTELETAFSELDKLNHTKGALLEIGAGSGFQSQKLSEKGYTVKAIDIKTSHYTNNSVWPIIMYDGFNIPFPDNYFDIIFSSNVLEHIPDIEEYQIEIARVLKNKGLAIHIVPSASWRFWTNIAHYFHIFKYLILKIYKNRQNSLTENAINNNIVESSLSARHISNKVLKVIRPHRHGELGNSLAELYYFSRYRWEKLFIQSGWVIKKHLLNNLLYSGYILFGTKLPIRFRKNLSTILGSACHIYILEKKTA